MNIIHFPGAPAVTFYECPLCHAVVLDTRAHATWHRLPEDG